MKLVSSLVVGAILTAGSYSYAAEEPANEPAGSNAVKTAVQKADSPVLESRTGFAGTGFIVEAGGDGTTATLTISGKWSPADAPRITHALTIKASTPIDKKSKEGSLVTEFGVPKSTYLEISYNNLTMPEVNLAEGIELETQRLHEFVDNWIAEAVKACGEQPTASAEGISTLAPDARSTALAVLQAEHFRCVSKAKDPDTFPTGSVALKKLDPVLWKKYEEKMLGLPVWFYGFTGSVGYKELAHREITDFSQHTAERVPFSFAGYAGFLPNERARYLGGGFEYKRDYDNPESKTLCKPGTVPTECFTGAFDSPQRDTNATVFLTTRVQSKFMDFPVGAELRIGYDFTDEAFGASLPIYLFSDGKGALRGGFRVGWDSDKDDVRFGLFIGAPFSLLGS